MVKNKSINDIFNSIYYIIYNLKDLDDYFYLNLYTYQTYCIIKKRNNINIHEKINIIYDILKKLCIYLEDTILINNTENKLKIKKLRKEYNNLRNINNKDIEIYIDYINSN